MKEQLVAHNPSPLPALDREASLRLLRLMPVIVALPSCLVSWLISLLAALLPLKTHSKCLVMMKQWIASLPSLTQKAADNARADLSMCLNPFQAQNAYYAAVDRLKAAQAAPDDNDMELLQLMVEQCKKDYLSAGQAIETAKEKIKVADQRVRDVEAAVNAQRLEIKEKYQREVHAKQRRVEAELERQARKESENAARKKQRAATAVVASSSESNALEMCEL